ncbi:MAG TPA: hypothetical protein VJN18_11230 [Polyangiaceae bacterium]|nr:hypothetical protein [Polyangiaceae bacterium]
MSEGQALAVPWVSTPGFLEDRAKRIHSALLGLNDVITRLARDRRLSTDNTRYKAFKRLLDDFGAWYGGTSMGTWLWSGTDATLETYERAIQDWERWIRQTYPDTAPSLPEPPPVFGPGGKPKESVPVWVWGAAGALVAFGVVKFFKSL